MSFASAYLKATGLFSLAASLGEALEVGEGVGDEGVDEEGEEEVDESEVAVVRPSPRE